MPKVSKETAEKFEDWGPAGKEWSQVLDGTLHVSFVEVAEDADLSPMLVGLPNDECQCSHWGYVLEGRIWHRSGGREEICEAGDAFYVGPGHTSGAYGGARFVNMTPAKEMAALVATWSVAAASCRERRADGVGHLPRSRALIRVVSAH